jgi:hypothetical protein
MTHHPRASKPTKGPWQAHEYANVRGRWYVIAENGHPVDEAIPLADEIQSEADARLIAAAPDLLAAVAKADTALLRALSDLMGYADGANTPAQDRVRDVLRVTGPIHEALIRGVEHDD